jgi:hypothetical protein
MERETKTALLVARVRPSLKAAAEQVAASDHRSVSSLIEKLLTDHIAGLESAQRPPTEPRKPSASAGRGR